MVSARSTSAIAVSNRCLQVRSASASPHRLLEPAVERDLRLGGRFRRLAPPGLIEGGEQAGARGGELLGAIGGQPARFDGIGQDQLALGRVDRLELEVPAVAVVAAHLAAETQIAFAQPLVELGALRHHDLDRGHLVAERVAGIEQGRIVGAARCDAEGADQRHHDPTAHPRIAPVLLVRSPGLPLSGHDRTTRPLSYQAK